MRSVTELRAGHIPIAINLPMDEIESRLADLGRNRTIVLICQAGQRGRITAELLPPCREDLAVLEGGTNAWMTAGLPVVRSNPVRWSLERQLRLGACQYLDQLRDSAWRFALGSRRFRGGSVGN